MDLQQYLRSEGKVILTTDVIHTHINFDRRTNYTQRNKQIEINFTDKKQCEIKDIIHSSTASLANFRKLKSTIDSLEKIFKPITISLLEKFPDYYFELMINNEHTCILDNYLHLIGCHRNGIPFTNEDLYEIHDFLTNTFSEIDVLIEKINNTIDIIDITSIILICFDSNKNDHFKYKNRGASEYVHALFNTDLKSTTLATIIMMNNIQIKLSTPIIQDEKVIFDNPHVVYGTIEVESVKSRKVHVKGFYLDGDKVTNIPFSEMVYCKAAGDEKDKYEKLFNYIANLLPGKKVKLIIKPLQPYVCHQDIETKNKHLISVEDIELT
ncbi:MAG: hypothetical protein QM504_18020 [Pseudomonadota bacterium]